MNGKVIESAQYLKCCSSIEDATFTLYETLSKKINQPESSFILGLAYDSLKCAKTIQRILDYFESTELDCTNTKRDFEELRNTISQFTKKISKTNNINYEMTCEIMKEISLLEDQLSSIYSNYAESSSMKILAEEFSPLEMNTTYFQKIFESFKEEKQGHKETLLELIYAIETKEADRLRNATPLVKYRNPEAWIRESTFHNFTNSPVSSQQQ